MNDRVGKNYLGITKK